MICFGQAWCLCLAAAVDSKVATIEVPRLARGILQFASFQFPQPAQGPPAALGLLEKLVNRRGSLTLYDLVMGSWSAQDTGSHFLCKWMLDLLPQLIGACLDFLGRESLNNQHTLVVMVVGF